MKRTTTLALAAAAFGAGLLPAGAANAQDMLRAFDQTASESAGDGDSVRMRFSLPFGQVAADPRESRLSFGFTHDLGGGDVRSLDMFSFSLTGGAPRVETPFALNAAGDGDGNWFSSPRNLLLLGAGVGIAWVIYDNNQDDDDAPPPPS